MSRRVLVAPIVGDGSADNPFRADVPGARMMSAAIGSILSGPQRGHPANDWTLVYADVEDEAAYAEGLERRGYSELLVADGLQAFDRRVASQARQGLPVEVRGESGRATVDALLARQYPYADRELWEEQAVGFERIRGGAPLVPFVEDSFTDTNGTALQDHAPDVGGAWEALAFDGGFSSSTNARIQSDRCESTSTTLPSRNYRNAAVPPGAEYELSVDFYTGSLANGLVVCYMLARATATGTANNDVTRYWSEIQYANTAVSHTIVKRIGASQTTLASGNSVAAGMAADTTYRCVFSITDALKRSIIPGIQTLSTADNDITQVGRVGVSPGRSSDGAYLDNFRAESEVANVSGESALAINSRSSTSRPPELTSGPTVIYPENKGRTGPDATPWVLTFTATGPIPVLNWQVHTETNRGGTLVASGTCNRNQPTAVSIAWNAPGIPIGDSTLYFTVDAEEA